MPAPRQNSGISKKANHQGTDYQVDTYFNVKKGRLKLREGEIENALIFYERDNQPGPKKADIVLYKGKPKSSLKTVLTAALGILTIVDKQRDIYFIDNVKFHVDVVKGLGSFVEIEAIDSDGSIGQEKLTKQCQRHLEALGIGDKDFIAVSYSDLILESK